jgi:hypothetical protein
MPLRIIGRVAATLLVLTFGIGATLRAVHHRPVVGVQPDGSFIVPNGQTLTPAGTTIGLVASARRMVVSPDGGLLAVVAGSNFSPRALHIIDLQTRALKQTIAIANSFVGVRSIQPATRFTSAAARATT